MPRVPEDFGDGGAFPEIHVAQYPMGMGRRSGANATSALAATAGSTGKVQYDAVVKQGTNRSQLVKSTVDALIPRNAHRDMNERLAEPSVSEQEETAKRTAEALQKIVNIKTTASMAVKRPDNSQADESLNKPVYIRYTDSTKERVIRMVEAPRDPLELAKFKHKKVPRGAAADPVPILRAPAKKLTAEDQEAWKIPPCISNWKNPQGFTIPLDKRLAADGRGLQDNTINDKFARLSEALYIAENQARSEVESRNAEKIYLLQKTKEKREEELRELAFQARKQRGVVDHNSSSSSDEGNESGAEERDRLRHIRKREREKDILREASGKKSKLARDQERDVSESIALGMAVPRTAVATGESQFDTRLFNQGQGMDAGFGGEDDYNVYSKPLISQGTGKQYKPKTDGAAEDAQTYESIKKQSAVQFESDPFKISSIVKPK